MSTGFLVTNLSGKLKRVIDLVNQQVLKKLYIYISDNNNPDIFKNNEWASKKIVDLYSTSFHLFPSIDVRIILHELKFQEERIHRLKDYDIDVLLLPKNYDEGKISNLKSQKKNVRILHFDDEKESDDKLIPPGSRKLYKNVVLGGTFDRLHTGHKILITEALMRCSEKITIGVTDGEMIKSKKLWELIEPCSKRIEEVKKFIQEVDSSVECSIMPITDMYGPTKSDPNFNLLVVSAETFKGALKVNEVRKENQLNELEIYVVDVAEDSSIKELEETKISSSNSRMRLLGTHLRPPHVSPNRKCKPYIIGLTGSVASGKSTICGYLNSLGATTIDCDKIGHDLYKPGCKIYFELIKMFGEEIVSPTGEIDRRVLGSIVFHNNEQLQSLNNLMWPAILKTGLEECDRLYNDEGKEIIILEAAVLVKAGWQNCVHEVWAVIIPEEEAIKRLMKRNNLSRLDAKMRYEAQSSNEEMVRVANVIFCSLWSPEFTQEQVTKAWVEVQKLNLCGE